MSDKKRILIADHSTEFFSRLTTCRDSEQYTFTYVKQGDQVLERAREFKPDLIILDLLLPKMHGIEVIRHLKQDSDLATIPFIITTYEVMVQNYHAALDNGAADFIIKPIDPPSFCQKLSDFFIGNLKPSKFTPRHSIETKTGVSYNPTPLFSTSYLKFWGTRGSVSVAGPEFIRHGGNTSCLEVSNGDDMIIVDAGTGIRPLGDFIDLNRHKEIHIFISHTHLDHVSSFPFFDPLYHEGITVNIYSPVSFEKTTKELFTELLAYSFFPVRLDQMLAKVNFIDLREGDRIDIGTLSIESCYTYHPGPTLGFKIRTPHSTFGYITDNEMLIGYHDHPCDIAKSDDLLLPHLDLIEFLQDCDMIIHEAQYFPREYEQKVGWGHSSISNATALFRFLNSKEWFVTHHDPKHTDVTLQIKFELHREVIKDCGLQIELRAARDGLIVPL